MSIKLVNFVNIKPKYNQSIYLSIMVSLDLLLFSIPSSQKITQKSMIQEQSKGTDVGKILLTHENYIFKMLQPSHAEATFELISNVFIKSQPLVTAYFQAPSAENNAEFQILLKIWIEFIKLFSRNKLSVGCFDSQNGELVGVSLTKDYHQVPQGLDQQYGSRSGYCSAVFKFQQVLISLMDEEAQRKLKQKRTFIDILAVTIKPEHSRRGILGNMMKSNIMLGLKAGYEHAFCFATNFRTSLTLKKLSFDLKVQGRASSFEMDGRIPFQKIDKEQTFSKIWMKELKLPQAN